MGEVRDNDTHDVFISFAGDDKTGDLRAAMMVLNFLESRGIKCWIYKRDEPDGAKFEIEITEAIKASKVLVLIYTKKANESPIVEKEIKIASKLGIPIIPFRLEAIPYNTVLYFHLQSYNWLDATVPPIEFHMQKLAEDIAQVISIKLKNPSKAISDYILTPKIDGRKGFRRNAVIAGIGVVAIIVIAAIVFYSLSAHAEEPSVQWYKIM